MELSFYAILGITIRGFSELSFKAFSLTILVGR